MRLPFGISSTPGIFQCVMEGLLQSIEDVVTYVMTSLLLGAWKSNTSEIFAQKLPYDNTPSTALVGVAVLQDKCPPVPATLPSSLHPLMKAAGRQSQISDHIIAAIQASHLSELILYITAVF